MPEKDNNSNNTPVKGRPIWEIYGYTFEEWLQRRDFEHMSNDEYRFAAYVTDLEDLDAYYGGGY